MHVHWLHRVLIFIHTYIHTCICYLSNPNRTSTLMEHHSFKCTVLSSKSVLIEPRIRSPSAVERTWQGNPSPLDRCSVRCSWKGFTYSSRYSALEKWQIHSADSNYSAGFSLCMYVYYLCMYVCMYGIRSYVYVCMCMYTCTRVLYLCM